MKKTSPTTPSSDIPPPEPHSVQPKSGKPNGTFFSFANVETGKAIGALLIPCTKLHIQTYKVVIMGEDMAINRYYTTEEMRELEYETEKTHVDPDKL